MAIAISGTANAYGEDNVETSETLSVDSGASGSDKVLFVFAFTEDGANDKPTGITYNGDALTLYGTSVASGDPSIQNLIEIWYKANPADGANDLVVTYPLATQDATFLAAAYTGVDTTTPIAANQTSNGDSDPAGDQTLSITTTNASTLILTGSVVDGNQFTTPPDNIAPAASDSQVTIFSSYDSGNKARGFQSIFTSQSAPTTTSYNTGFNADFDTAGEGWAILAVELTPAGGGGSTPKGPLGHPFFGPFGGPIS